MRLFSAWRAGVKKEKNSPMLDFVRPQTRSGLLIPLVLLATLIAALLAFQEYQTWMQREAETVKVEKRMSTLMAEKERQRRTVLHSPERKQQEAAFSKKRSPLLVLDTIARAWDTDIALTNMRIDTAVNTADVILEAKNLERGFAFVERLSKEPGMTVALSQNIQKANDPLKPVVLKLKVGLQ
jgi:hypothetical protein